MPLVLTSKRGERVELADGVRVAIQGEHEWFAAGTREQIASLRAVLGRCATPVREDLLVLDFGNVVGLYPVADGVLEVRSGKWTAADFDLALEDLFRVCADLPFHANETSPLPVAIDSDVSNDVLYRTFIYLREALRHGRSRSLAIALEAIARDPHRRFERTEARVPLGLLRELRFDKLPVYVASTTRWARGAAGVEGLGLDVAGLVPAELPESQVRDTFDTAENRFVRVFVDYALFVVAATRHAVDGRTSRHRVQADARWMQALLQTARMTAPLCDAGRLTHAAMGSATLQRRRGYRDVLHHFVRMRHAAKGLPFSSTAFDALLEARDVAHLYELWAFFIVVDALRTILGPPTRAGTPKRTALGVEVGRLEVGWGEQTRAVYQEAFSAAKGTSYSLSYEPDVALYTGGKLHLFDAKFRLERHYGDDEGVKQGDIDKMHAYRDAIRACRSAWVLYPGADEVFYDAELGPRTTGQLTPDSQGVGAVPLRPGDRRVPELDRVLRGLLGVASSEQGGDALRTEPNEH